VTALGSFEYKNGGFPSAILAHSNVATVPKEIHSPIRRRWFIPMGCKRHPEIRGSYASLSEEGQEEQQLKDAVRWEFSPSLFPSASS